MIESFIPKLNTVCKEQCHFLEKHFYTERNRIADWFQNQWELSLPPVYGSVDLRNAGFKLAPIDMNLFPAGFNNLNPNHLAFSIEAAKKIINQLVPNTKKILIIPESHTRNLFYWDSIKILQTILAGAGFTIKFSLLDDDLTQAKNIILTSGESLLIEPLQRVDDELRVNDFVPELILLNNDLSSGIPPILQNLKQKLIPPAELGWSQRLKSDHFQYYADVSNEFAQVIGIDPWLIAPLFRHCGRIDFMQQEGMSCVINYAEKLFEEIQAKYDQYNISHQPFLIIKADAGTYGMAVMTVRNVAELKSLNRKQRTRMASTKGGQPVNRVIIQEGVYTFETWGEDRSVAEPVVYLWGSDVVGGFYRVHQDRGVDENLNAPGMRFEPVAFAQSCQEASAETEYNPCNNRFYVYGVIAKLSMLAAAREIKDQTQK